ncbi:uncharacterized protein MONOS_6340 [Monocercomonoides exilis]|uniref:uncharacterized protein n=1 Tax=Monocercomonoides exilis TaxID=2049356 RepID=UPI00355A3F47|nr:hypothetical protein MONOS_6340 [Monocercomonoides exilis]|eukprot:MONOS_6340.1-p1 / transcript=MONOS_6340.1 / gene=MONOS_6340 / organism=Monocercomonoides_exilis_PA203 / gene_product=unspecified product / transcript_product=unspecified product / location=Mono_scaffold00198:48671-49549(+) / protein_length=252 / sequence_SO=supercontig / SO=protein_coding / is_pseudo=false
MEPVLPKPTKRGSSFLKIFGSTSEKKPRDMYKSSPTKRFLQKKSKQTSVDKENDPSFLSPTFSRALSLLDSITPPPIQRTGAIKSPERTIPNGIVSPFFSGKNDLTKKYLKSLTVKKSDLPKNKSQHKISSKSEIDSLIDDLPKKVKHPRMNKRQFLQEIKSIEKSIKWDAKPTGLFQPKPTDEKYKRPSHRRSFGDKDTDEDERSEDESEIESNENEEEFDEEKDSSFSIDEFKKDDKIEQIDPQSIFFS